MSNIFFLVEGFDGMTPLQAYCSVMTPHFIFIDTIYPHPNISLCVGNKDNANQFGDNAYTRQTVVGELIALDRTIHCVKHFYHRYKAVLKTYSKIESMERARYRNQPSMPDDVRVQYINRMHRRLKQIYVRYLQRAIPEVPVTDNSEWVIQPYLLAQILQYI